MLDREYLQIALSSIDADATGPHLRGYYAALRTAAILPVSKERVPKSVQRGVSRATEDLWSALTMLWRIEWQREMKRAEHLDDMKWMYFLASDVRELHVVLRSYYDSLLILVSGLVLDPGQMSLRSFRKLLQWLERPQNVHRIDAELRAVLLSAHWFWSLREVRDGLVHQGAQPLVFPQMDRLGFQVHNTKLNGLVRDGMMLNEHIVDLQLYAACQVGQAIGFLQRLCYYALRQLELEDIPPNLRAYHPGLGVLQQWAVPLMPTAEG